MNRRVFRVVIHGVGELTIFARSSVEALRKTLTYYAAHPFPEALRITVKVRR